MADQGKTNACSTASSSPHGPTPAGAAAPRTILYLHGFLSSAQSTKARFFRERFESLPQVSFHAIDFNPTPGDFETMTTTGQINRLRQCVLDRCLSDIGLVGSSFGGLVGLHYAHRFGGIARMLLLAPAVVWLSGGLSERELRQWQEAGVASVFHPAFDREVPIRYDLHLDGLRYLEPVPPAAPTTIIHGRRDKTVPIAHSRAFAADYPDDVRLIEVDADHDLNPHLDLIWETVESFLLDAVAG
ncbi:MAG: YqiA/YcfP family alpha/beta fold hydrolase [Anaerolineae bacterium]|jgi:pimeloyl-ACP methyl ester carboxylesterase